MIDAHVHIERGPYTLEWVNEFINQAIKMGINELYLLEHTHRFKEFEKYYEEICSYSNYQLDWYKKRTGLALESYFELINKYKNHENEKIKIKWGLEVCYLSGIENEIEKLKKENRMDFYTGSVHWINGWGFDHNKEFWLDKEIDKEYKKYFEEEKRLIKSGVFDNLAHPDSIKCFNHYPSYNLNETYEEIINIAKKTNIQFEQSCGLYNNYSHQKIGLEENYLKKLKENKMRIITASDAHCPEDLGKNIDKALLAIQEA